MSRLQFGLLGAALGAIIVALGLIAVDLSTNANGSPAAKTDVAAVPFWLLGGAIVVGAIFAALARPPEL